MSVERFSLRAGIGLAHVWALLWFFDQPKHRVAPVFMLSVGWGILGIVLLIVRQKQGR